MVNRNKLNRRIIRKLQHILFQINTNASGRGKIESRLKIITHTCSKSIYRIRSFFVMLPCVNRSCIFFRISFHWMDFLTKILHRSCYSRIATTNWNFCKLFYIDKSRIDFDGSTVSLHNTRSRRQILEIGRFRFTEGGNTFIRCEYE